MPMDDNAGAGIKTPAEHLGFEVGADRKLAGWPEIVDNHYRLSRFVYAGMIDYLRRVSTHVLIGRATRAGRELPNYFALCREDPA